MKNYLLIDGGTTNTRLYYVSDGNAVDTLKLKMGVRSFLHKPELLKQEIRNAVETLFSKHGEASCIIASGMITSEMGLYNLPHIPVPAGLEELHAGMAEVMIPEVSSVPFYFIPGLKQDSGDFRKCDIMRGEECEVFGLAKKEYEDCLFVLPGSHSKLITMQNGKITSFSTQLTGEMAAALSSGTILASSVDMEQPLDADYLCRGYAFANEQGLNAALFKTRILDTVYNTDASLIYSFFLGAVLCDEINSIIRARAKRIVLAGQSRLAKATAEILQRVTDKEIIAADEKTAALANVRGMIKIFEY